MFTSNDKYNRLSKVASAFPFVIVLLTIPLYAQLPATYHDVRFIYLSEEPGVPDAFIYSIYQDSKGFFWFCTADGLYQYDGYSYKAFTHNILDETTISHPIVYTITEDRAGHLWIGTGRGLDKLDRDTWQITRHTPHPAMVAKGLKERNKVFSIYEDGHGDIWAGTASGIARFDTLQQTFTTETYLVDFVPHWILYKNEVLQVSDSTLLVATNRGLYTYNKTAGTFQRIMIAPEETDKVHVSIRDAHVTEDGTFWLATSQGLKAWRPDSPAVYPNQLPEALKRDVTRVVKGPNGRIWLSFPDHGLVVFDPPSGAYHQFVCRGAVEAEQVTRIGPVCMAFDHLGDLWMGRVNGIWKLALHDRGIDWFKITDDPLDPVNSVRAFGIAVDNPFYISTLGGVFRQESGGVFTPVLYEIDGQLRDVYALTFYFKIDPQRTLWSSIASPYGIGLFSMKANGRSFERIEAGEVIAGVYISTIQNDIGDDDMLWLATNGGLAHMNKNTVATTWHLPRDQHSELPLNSLQYLEQQDSNVLWTYFMGASALGKFDERTKSFEVIRPPDRQAHVLEGSLTGFDMDNNGRIWISSSYGLTSFNTNDRSFAFYTTADGLSENKLEFVIADDFGNVWALGSKSFTQFRPDEGFVRQFDVSKDLRRLNRAAATSPGGEVYIGGTNGYYRIDPRVISQETTPPRIVLTDFKVSDKSLDIGVPAEDATDIKITHRDNIVTFEFVGLHFLQPDQNKYRCKLEGFDPTWRDLGTERKATYTNLDPGHYTFRVEAANADGIWSTNGLAVNLGVSPAVWQTSWFKILMVLIALSIIYAIYRNRQRQLGLKREKEIAETSARYKSQFLANISHEIRTPMNAIVGMSKLMQDTPMSGKQNNYVHAIRESSENLVSIINDLLDHSKIESGQFTFVRKPFELDVSVRQICTTLGFRAEEKGLSLTSNIEKDVPLHLVGDPVRLNQILLNLCGNAIRFTDQGGVTISVRAVENTEDTVTLQFDVADTGVGIAEEKLSRIFESFTQADDDTFIKYGGTGLGLSISKQLVEQQGGQLQVASTVGRGTTFTFNLDFEKGSAPDQTFQQPAKFDLRALDILVVEDTLFNQMLAREILQKHIPEVRVEMADNGQIALEKLAIRDYDLVLMDIKMPVMNGYDATMAIRALKDPRKKNIPILGLSASAIPEHIRKYLEAGMNDCVTKPIDANELLQKMQSILQSVTP